MIFIPSYNNFTACEEKKMKEIVNWKKMSICEYRELKKIAVIALYSQLTNDKKWLSTYDTFFLVLVIIFNIIILKKAESFENIDYAAWLYVLAKYCFQDLLLTVLKCALNFFNCVLMLFCKIDYRKKLWNHENEKKNFCRWFIKA